MGIRTARFVESGFNVYSYTKSIHFGGKVVHSKQDLVLHLVLLLNLQNLIIQEQNFEAKSNLSKTHKLNFLNYAVPIF